jgi:hypothetical protein
MQKEYGDIPSYLVREVPQGMAPGTAIKKWHSLQQWLECTPEEMLSSTVILSFLIGTMIVPSWP